MASVFAEFTLISFVPSEPPSTQPLHEPNLEQGGPEQGVRSRGVHRAVGIPAPVRAPDHPSCLEEPNLSVSPGNPYDGNNFIFQCARLYRTVYEKCAALERAIFIYQS